MKPRPRRTCMYPVCTRYPVLNSWRIARNERNSHNSSQSKVIFRSEVLVDFLIFFQRTSVLNFFLSKTVLMATFYGPFLFRLQDFNVQSSLRFKCSKLLSYLKYLCIYCVLLMFFWCIPTRFFWNSTIYCPCVLSLSGVLCSGPPVAIACLAEGKVMLTSTFQVFSSLEELAKTFHKCNIDKIDFKTFTLARSPTPPSLYELYQSAQTLGKENFTIGSYVPVQYKPDSNMRQWHTSSISFITCRRNTNTK